MNEKITSVKKGWLSRLISNARENRRKNKQERKLNQDPRLVKSVQPTTLSISVKKVKNYQTVEGFLSVRLPETITTRKIKQIYKHYFTSLHQETEKAIQEVVNPGKDLGEGIDFED